MVIGIVADDLTGAADSVAPFAKRGFQANVGFGTGGKPRFALAEGEALAFDTETRELSVEIPGRITTVVRAATRRLLSFSPTLLYKKSDSTLRGHLRLELDAMHCEAKGRLAIVCPAFPANGRTVMNGVLYVHGEPQLQTVREAFRAMRDKTTSDIPLEMLHAGVDNLDAHLSRAVEAGIQTVFCDAVEQSDLEIIARAILRQPQRYLPVGSAGLTAALAAYTDAEPTVQMVPTWSETAFTEGRVLVVVGSQNPVSHRQAAFLAEKTKISPFVTEMEEIWIRKDFPIGADDAEMRSYEMRKCNTPTSQWAYQLFESGRRIALVTSPESATPDWHMVYVSKAIHEICRFCYHSGLLVNSLIVTGGDTAITTCRSLGAIGLNIIGEKEPGVIQGRLKCRPQQFSGLDFTMFDGLPIITKAGGFGTEDTLARCVGLA